MEELLATMHMYPAPATKEKMVRPKLVSSTSLRAERVVEKPVGLSEEPERLSKGMQLAVKRLSFPPADVTARGPLHEGKSIAIAMEYSQPEQPARPITSVHGVNVAQQPSGKSKRASPYRKPQTGHDPLKPTPINPFAGFDDEDDDSGSGVGITSRVVREGHGKLLLFSSTAARPS